MDPTLSAADAATQHAQAVLTGAPATGAPAEEDSSQKRERDEATSFEDAADKKLKPTFASNGESPYDTNQFTLKFLIKRNMGGAIIGRGGTNIKALREGHVAKIEVTPGWEGHPDRLVALTGFRADIIVAFSSILDALWAPNPNSNQERPPTQTFRFLVPNSHMGAVIGKAGCNIGRIRDESGAQVKAEKQGGQVDRVVELTGDQAQLQAGCELLVGILGHELPDKLLPAIADLRLIQPFHFENELTLQTMQQNAFTTGAIGGGLGGRPAAPAGGAAPAANVGEAIKFSILPEAIGKVIGKGGQNIQQMRASSGASINVDSKTNEVTITGSPEQKQVAFILLTQALNKE